ncbi:glycosyltransferase [Luedemannella flava]
MRPTGPRPLSGPQRGGTPGRHHLRTHVAAGPAGHGRCGRHERLHRRGGAPPGTGRRRGGDLHPGDVERPAAGGRDGPGCDGAARDGRPVRGPRQGGPARPDVRLHERGAAGGGGRPGRLLRRDPLALLAVRAGRLAGQGPVGVPLVHTAHTLAKVKNAMLAEGDRPEPRARVLGEEQVVAEADRLVANTPAEAHDLIRLYGAGAEEVTVVPPGVDLDRFVPPAHGQDRAVKARARRRLGLPPDDLIVAFVGRIQPLKAPDVLLRAATAMRTTDPAIAGRVTTVIAGGPSGSGLDRPTSLIELASELGIGDSVRFLPPLPRDRLVDLYHAADLVAVPSHNESFGLVALEAQASGTPVVAAAVGGLPTAVRDGVSGALVHGHDPDLWAKVLGDLLAAPRLRAELAAGAVAHARDFSWNETAVSLLAVYREVVIQRRAARAAMRSGAFA